MSGGPGPVQRPVFQKLHGAAKATFTVLADLPNEFRVGVFAEEKNFDSWVRISSDTDPSQPDLKTTVGFAITLFGFDAQKLLPPEPVSRTPIFLLQNPAV